MHTHLLEVLKDVIDDELFGLIGVHPSEWVQIDHSIFKANKWESQGAFQGLVREEKRYRLKTQGDFLGCYNSRTHDK